MRIFLAGATGALGKQLLPRLTERGAEVTGMTRSESKQELIRDLGGRPVVADALEPESVAQAVARAEPEVIVHQLTAIPHALDMRHFARDFAQTNRLRTEGTDHLLAAGRATGVHRFVAQSYAPAIFARVGGPVKAEDDPLDESPPAPKHRLALSSPRETLLRCRGARKPAALPTRESPPPPRSRWIRCAIASSTCRPPRVRVKRNAGAERSIHVR